MLLIILISGCHNKSQIKHINVKYHFIKQRTKLDQITFDYILFTNNIANLLSGTVHTGVEVCRIDLELSRLVEWPWLQLIYYAICLPHGCNFRWRKESLSRSEYWLVCCCWILEVKFNKSLSSSIIRLANYSVTTSLIYKLIV